MLLLAVVCGVRIPPLPASVSQVEAAKAIINDRPPNELISPERLAKRLYHLAFLEGDPARPHAIYHQLQSLAFYRMNIERYLHLKVMPIWKEVAQASSKGTSVTIIAPVGRLKDGETATKEAALSILGKAPAIIDDRANRLAGLAVFDDDKAYETYDGLVKDFWKNYASLFSRLYFTRISEGRESDVVPTGKSLFSELPKDKTDAFKYLDRNRASNLYEKHYRMAFHTSAAELEPAMSNFDNDEMRRISNYLGSKPSSLGTSPGSDPGDQLGSSQSQDAEG